MQVFDGLFKILNYVLNLIYLLLLIPTNIIIFFIKSRIIIKHFETVPKDLLI